MQRRAFISSILAASLGITAGCSGESNEQPGKITAEDGLLEAEANFYRRDGIPYFSESAGELRNLEPDGIWLMAIFKVHNLGGEDVPAKEIDDVAVTVNGEEYLPQSLPFGRSQLRFGEKERLWSQVTSRSHSTEGVMSGVNAGDTFKYFPLFDIPENEEATFVWKYDGEENEL